MVHFIDIHSHRPLQDGRIFTLVNTHAGFDRIAATGFFSSGIHPWFLQSETASMEFKLLESAASQENVLAIGECGLDRACDTDFLLQRFWFERQVDLAISVNKPLIIHCVNAYQEVLETLKRQKTTIPVIFHGFNKRLEVAEKIIAEGHFISFGKHLFAPAVRELFARLPSDRIFLETDASGKSIVEIYDEAARARTVAENELQEQIAANFTAVFGSAVLK